MIFCISVKFFVHLKNIFYLKHPLNPDGFPLVNLLSHKRAHLSLVKESLWDGTEGETWWPKKLKLGREVRVIWVAKNSLSCKVIMAQIKRLKERMQPGNKIVEEEWSKTATKLIIGKKNSSFCPTQGNDTSTKKAFHHWIINDFLYIGVYFIHY